MHALVDGRHPLDSMLVLAGPTPGSPGDRDGLLRAGELFEGTRWAAEMVVLSGCETILGRTARGEGVIGLTAGLHRAGVPSVVASLWKVDDCKTKPLMDAFYRHLRDDRTKDEALQRAQLEMLDSPTGSYSFYWAAFVLSGVGAMSPARRTIRDDARALELLLVWLGLGNRDHGVEEFERLRAALGKFFENNGCGGRSDELADTAFSRIGDRLVKQTMPSDRKPAPFAYGVAQFLVREDRLGAGEGRAAASTTHQQP